MDNPVARTNHAIRGLYEKLRLLPAERRTRFFGVMGAVVASRAKHRCVRRALVISQMQDVLYNLYRSKIMRASKSTKEFARWVIWYSLSIGFNNVIVSIPEASLNKFSIKKQAARDLLKKLHDVGIIVFLAGTSLPIHAKRGSLPMGFMLNPAHEDTVQEKIEALRTKKITMADIKEI